MLVGLPDLAVCGHKYHRQLTRGCIQRTPRCMLCGNVDRKHDLDGHRRPPVGYAAPAGRLRKLGLFHLPDVLDVVSVRVAEYDVHGREAVDPACPCDLKQIDRERPA